MLYIVECSYADPESEAGWNRFYSQPAAGAGFRKRVPRFAALPGRSPPAAGLSCHSYYPGC